MKKVSVVIPAYNEELGIGNTLTELCQTIPDNYSIIVVDDGSTDNTFSVASSIKDDRIRVIRHKYNRGYGSAIQTACRYADGEVVVWYDADGQHRPNDLMEVVNKLIAENLDYVIGVRTSSSHVDKNRKFGKRILSWFANKLAKEPMEDVNSGLRAFKRDIILRHLKMLPERFGASTVTSFIMQEMGYLGGTSPIVVRQRKGISTVKPIKDGIATISLIMNIILLFRAKLVLTWISLILISAGIIYGVAKAFTLHNGIPVLSAITIIAGVQIYFLGIISAQIASLRLGKYD